MVQNGLIDQVTIAINKFKKLPKDNLIPRLLLGIKKQITNYPQFITLQTVSACNLQCKHCFINDYQTEIEDGITKIMKFDEFLKFAERMEDIIRHAEYFSFSSFEALLNKHLFRMMDHLLMINPRLKFSMLSNTMLLHDENVKKLEGYPISDLTISLDGMTKDVVENFKNGVHFEKIIEAIGRLNRSSLKDKVGVGFVAHQNNIHQLPDYVDYVHSLGVKTIYVSNILTFTTKNAHLALYTKEGNETAEQLFAESIRRAKRNKQTLQLPLLKPKLKGCQAVETFFVNIDGSVAPCDFLAVSTPFTLFGKTVKNAPQIFGNVLSDDPLEIYRSEPYQNFRKAHRLAKELPEACKNCIDAYGLMCSNRT